MAESDQGSLYGTLAEEAPHGVEPGESLTTKTKETVDNDAEAFAALENGVLGS